MLFEDLTPGWRKALLRVIDPKAHKYPLRIKLIAGDLATSDELVFKVTSGTTGKWEYIVTLTFGPDGVDVRCGCMAQKHNLTCDHSAMALEYAGLLTVEEVEALEAAGAVA